MVILCDKEVAILIGPTLAIHLKSHMRFRCGALPVKVNLIN